MATKVLSIILWIFLFHFFFLKRKQLNGLVTEIKQNCQVMHMSEYLFSFFHLLKKNCKTFSFLSVFALPLCLYDCKSFTLYLGIKRIINVNIHFWALRYFIYNLSHYRNKSINNDAQTGKV